jgi:hypothetical protein
MDIYIFEESLVNLDYRFLLSKLIDCNIRFLDPTIVELEEHSLFLIIDTSLLNHSLVLEKIKKIRNKSLFILHDQKSLQIDNDCSYIGHYFHLINECGFDQTKTYIATQLQSDISHIKTYLPNANIMAFDRWLYELYEYYIKQLILKQANLNEVILPIKRFSIFCNRYEKRRFNFYSKLITNNLLDSFYYTFAGANLDTSQVTELISDTDNSIEKNKITEWVKGIPYSIDKSSLFGWEHPHYPHNLRDYFNSSLIHISMETQPHLNSFITEKTYRAIFYKKPFILISQYKALAMLREEGYKTFNSFIDETYDTYEKYEDRVNAVIKEITRLNSLPINELEDIARGCSEIVEHNFNKLFENIHRKIPENFLFSSISKTL